VNKQALETNKFMTITENPALIQKKVLEEHTALCDLLQVHQFEVMCFDNKSKETPDALFCNHWLTIHHPMETGRKNSYGVIYPMAVENRRLEIREDILLHIQELYKEQTDFTFYDLRVDYDWAYLEGTGSMVLDRYHKKIYACISPRTYFWKLLQFKNHFGYELIPFHAEYKQSPVYHTNVMMAIGKDWAVVSLDLVNDQEQKKVFESLQKDKKHVILLSEYQVSQFCGNILEITNTENITYTVMSEKAYRAFTEEQRKILGNILYTPLPTIETYGGGGVRCCIAEI
jgi:hypothetical protein